MANLRGLQFCCWVVRGSNNFIQRICGWLGGCISHHKFGGHAFYRCHFLFFRLRHVSFFRPKDAIIDAHSTEPILDQDNQPTFYKLTRYVFVIPRTPLTLYGRLRQLYTRRNQRELEGSGSSFFPSRRSHRHFCTRINFFVDLSSFRARVRKVRGWSIFKGFVWSRRGCGRFFILTQMSSSFSFQFKLDVKKTKVWGGSINSQADT